MTFDIDANGIVHVSAQDKATGKSQEIRITGGSGLTEEEIQRMVKDAEANRDSDKKRREVVDTHNALDGMILACEKMLKDGDAKLSANSKTELSSAIAEAKGKLSSENLEELKSATEKLQGVSHKLATEMYAQAGAGPGTGPESTGPGPQDKDAEGPNPKKDEDVVDADFKEV